MSKSLRLSEKWFRRGLWLVALAFAGFLIGLGSTIVGDLPRVERTLGPKDFIDRSAADPLRATITAAERSGQQAEREQAELKLTAARQASRAARETFANWLATRHATAQPDQDGELIARTKALDALKQKEDEAQRDLGAQNQIALDARQSQQQAQQKLAVLEDEANVRLEAENRRVELRVFGYRLALTLPLLVVAGWLFVRKRKSQYWPFVWGFIYFALFAFFVELVPYLPSYGGYVRYVVGIVLTVLVGRYAIVALNRYLARQKLAEAQPDLVRREELGYDTALARLAKGVCPGCERPVDLKNTEIDFCPHCGIGLFDHCRVCTARKSAFSRFCHACGTAADAPGAPELPAQVQPASTT
ncbi:zinc ribbon domain-containing protein [Variovorax sp. PBL-E5]|uniref:zinc ribbon domain-containing protein n=1 Tax=Variovorax sp. PBL-E5 TaxID=434014 RepID=UPI0013188AAD|nr:zinc ribbon domain-containing protein [Variovorax sp. PBL-E5]VTU17957.1 Double zinc ribbon [Variovorax sp. PBL-E5]